MARSMTKAKGTKSKEAPAASENEVAGVINVPEEVVEEPKIEEKEEVIMKREFKETDGILCRSVTPGKLVMVGKKTGMKYIWNEYGHEYEVEYRDLVIAVRTRSKFVFGPRFIIEDQDFIDEFNLVKKFYDESYNIADLENILILPANEMKTAIEALPPEAKKNFKNIASTAVQDKTLDSLEKIRILDDLFGIELKLLSEM